MRLFEHPDFDQAILQAAEFFREQGLRPAIIEKDYYVTEALRTLTISTVTSGTRTLAAGAESSANGTATAANNKIIFKGGTSLSKVRAFPKVGTSSLVSGKVLYESQ